MVAQCSASNLCFWAILLVTRYNSHRFKVPGAFYSPVKRETGKDSSFMPVLPPQR